MNHVNAVIQNIETAIRWAKGGTESPMPTKWAEDALVILRKQAPYIIREECLMSYDMGYMENRNKPALEPVLITYSAPQTKRVTLVKRDGYKGDWSVQEMGKSWRLWSSVPTEEQRGETAWNS